MVRATHSRQTLMSSTPHHYRITVAPVEKGGLPCSGHCSLEFQQRARHDWLQLLGCGHRPSRFSGDDRAAAAIATELLDGLLHKYQDDAAHPLSALGPRLQPLLEELRGQLKSG